MRRLIMVVDFGLVYIFFLSCWRFFLRIILICSFQNIDLDLIYILTHLIRINVLNIIFSNICFPCWFTLFLGVSLRATQLYAKSKLIINLSLQLHYWKPQKSVYFFNGSGINTLQKKCSRENVKINSRFLMSGFPGALLRFLSWTGIERSDSESAVLRNRSTQKTQYSKIRTFEKSTIFSAIPTTTREIVQAFWRMIWKIYTIIFFRN